MSFFLISVCIHLFIMSCTSCVFNKYIISSTVEFSFKLNDIVYDEGFPYAFCVKWLPVESQGTTPPTTSFHVRLPQPKFQSRRKLLVCFVMTASALMGWRWYPGKEVCLSHGMLQSLPRWQTYTFRPLHPQLAPQLRWRRLENKPSRPRCQGRTCSKFGNFGPNQRIGCAILKQSGPQNYFCLCQW